LDIIVHLAAAAAIPADNVAMAVLAEISSRFWLVTMPRSSTMAWNAHPLRVELSARL